MFLKKHYKYLFLFLVLPLLFIVPWQACQNSKLPGLSKLSSFGNKVIFNSQVDLRGLTMADLAWANCLIAGDEGPITSIKIWQNGCDAVLFSPTWDMSSYTGLSLSASEQRASPNATLPSTAIQYRDGVVGILIQPSATPTSAVPVLKHPTQPVVFEKRFTNILPFTKPNAELSFSLEVAIPSVDYNNPLPQTPGQPVVHDGVPQMSMYFQFEDQISKKRMYVGAYIFDPRTSELIENEPTIDFGSGQVMVLGAPTSPDYYITKLPGTSSAQINGFVDYKTFGFKITTEQMNKIIVYARAQVSGAQNYSDAVNWTLYSIIVNPEVAYYRFWSPYKMKTIYSYLDSDRLLDASGAPIPNPYYRQSPSYIGVSFKNIQINATNIQLF